MEIQNKEGVEIKDQQVILFSKKEKFIFWILGGLAILSPLIFKWPALWEYLSIEKSPALIGDAIGGISAPFVGLLAAFLVYKSFEAQIRANANQLKLIKDSHDDQMKVISQEMKYNYITSLTTEFIESFEKLKFEFKGHSIFGSKIVDGVYTSAYNYKNLNRGQKEYQKYETLHSDQFYYSIDKLRSYLVNLVLIKLQIKESELPLEVKLLKNNIIMSFIEDNIASSLEHTFTTFNLSFNDDMMKASKGISQDIEHLRSLK